MKKLFLTFFLSAAFLFSYADLIITGVVDGPLSGGTPKAIEVYVVNDIPDLSIYGLGSANNGGGTDGQEYTFPAISAQAGDFLYVASEATNFTAFFGFAPTFSGNVGGVAFVNGDDAVELFKDGVVIDVFGDINVDGSGQPWEYLDGWAYRANATGPDGTTFTIGNWSFSGPNALDGESDNATAATPFPIGTYSQITVDGTASGIYLPALCLQDNVTGFGNNTDAAADVANGSELNGAHAVIDGGVLYLMLTGNLETNFNKVSIFIDAAPGGQNRLLGTNPDVDFNGLNRMGEDGTMGNGLTFDAGFEADYFYTITNGVGGSGGYEAYASTAPTDGSGGMGTSLGGGPGTTHSLMNGHTLGINNSNVAGVDDMNINDPSTVLTGIEFGIPLSEIGNPTGEIKITAFINSGSYDFLSNQVLCGLGGGQANLGEPRAVDFGTIAGDQFFTVCAGVDGGFVFTEDGESKIYTCPGDGIDDLGVFDSSTTSTANFTYVVTDLNGVILGLPGSDTVNFEGAGLGTCLVWGLSYTGNITAMLGDTASAVALTDSCYDLSSNYVTVVRDTAEGGMVMTEDGETTVYTCPGDGIDDIIFFDSTGTSGAKFTYVVTDENAVILGVPDEDSQNFDGAGTGNCLVWGLSYTGNLTAMVGDTASLIALSDGCFDLSDNFITVVRDTAEAGTVVSTLGLDTVNVCLGTPSQEVLSFDNPGASNAQYIYVVTDTATTILGVSTDGNVDFSGAPAGECWVWGLSYTGNLLVAPGDTVLNEPLLTDRCFDLSDNFVVVQRDSGTVDGGMVSTQMGEDTIYICLETGMAMMRFDSTGTVGSNFNYVVTDANGVILGLPPGDAVDFGGAGQGECWVWGLSYTGNVTAAVGDTASITQLTDGCYDLSDNFVVVFRDSVEGGTVSTTMGEDTIDVCINTNSVYMFDQMGSVSMNYAYVITDTATKILGVSTDGVVDFAGAGPGECWVWGLSFSGDLLVGLGDTVATAGDLTTGCFDLSDNYVVANREEVEGGTVTAPFSVDTVYVCHTDTISDAFVFGSTGASGGAFTFVVTDPATEILGLPGSDTIDFSGAGTGECWVWGLSFTGNVLVSLGDTVAGSTITDGCYDLSDNFIVVMRDSTGGACLQNVGIEDELTFANFKLFPVPANQELHIAFTSEIANQPVTTARIFGLNGQLVGEKDFQTLPSGKNEFDLNISGLGTGLYLLQLQNGSRTISRRFIKE